MRTSPALFKAASFKVISHLLITGLIFNPVLALADDLPITPDGSTNTQVTQTASGIDQINIAAPNSAGLSHNRFTDYNVNTAGQVINNFSGSNGNVVGGSGSTAVTSTAIGGLVIANQNLINAGGAEAKVILNEVTSTNNSQILGYIEIAGGKAELIIANPNGIACRSCGFINTSRLSLIAGKSEFDGSGNLGFGLSGSNVDSGANLIIPLITIEGLGLDAQRTTATDIISSSMKLIAGIYGSNDNAVSLKTGDEKFNYNSKEVTSNDDSISSGSSELFAIDASSLGLVQSGRIFLVATKNGLGVNLGGSLIANKELNIDTKGNIYYSILASETSNIDVKATGNLVSKDSGSIIQASGSSPAINIQSAGLTNLGNINSSSISITTSADLNNLGNIISASSFGDITLTSSAGNIFNFGNIISFNNLTLNSNAGDISNYYNIAANTTVTLNANLGEIANYDEASLGYLSLTNSDGSTTEFLATNLNLNSKNLTNSGIIKGVSSEIINSENLINYGVISANENSTITSGNITNSGYLTALETLTINALSGKVTNSNQILSEDNLTINAYDLDNLSNATSDSISTALISSLGKSLNLNISNQIFNSAELSTKENLNIADLNILNNSGKIFFNQSVVLNIKDFTNSNLISAGNDLTINSATNVDNYGAIFSKSDLTINANNTNSTFTSFNNYGTITALSDLTITSKNNIYNDADGILKTAANFYLTSDLKVKNYGEISSSYAIDDSSISSIEAESDIENYGYILGQKNILLTADNLINSKEIQAGNILTLDVANQLDNNGDGNIFSANELAIKNVKILNNSGNIQGNVFLNIKADQINNYNFILALDELEITASNSINNEAAIVAKNLTIKDSGTVTNSGLIQADEKLTFNLTNLFNLENSTLADLASPVIYSAGEINLNISNLLTNSGIISAKNQTLSFLNSGSLENSGIIETIGNEEEDALEIKDIANLTNQSAGNISSAAKMNINISGSLNNYGIIASDKDFEITAAEEIKTNNINNYNQIISNAGLSFAGKSLNNNSQIFAKNNLSITVDDFSNATTLSEIVSSNDNDENEDALETTKSKITFNTKSFANHGVIDAYNIEITNDFEVSNSGTIQSNNDIGVTTGSLVNSNKIISQNNLTIDAVDGAVTNNKTLQAGGNIIINAASFDNSATETSVGSGSYNSPLVLAINDLTINALTIKNNHTKPTSGTVISSGIAANKGDVNLNGTNINNDYGLIRGANVNTNYLNHITASSASSLSSLSVSSLSTGDLIFSNSFGEIMATEAIDLDLGTSNYTITGTLTAADYVDITADSITNLGNITTTDYIKLTATSGSITNGVSGGDNSNIKLVAGSYLTFVANTFINNYATLSATTDLTLSATNGNITNYSSGSITGGNGTTTINATNGTFKNSASSSELTSNNDLILNLKNLENYGGIYVANDLTANVSNDLNNYSAALIWAGNDATINISNSFNNVRGAVYVVNDLTLQKNNSLDSSLNKMESFYNLSGDITTESGDMFIKAKTFKNGHENDEAALDLIWDETYYIGDPGNNGLYRTPNIKLGNFDSFNWVNVANYNFPTWWSSPYAAKRIYNGDNRTIYSGNELTIESTSFTNDVANIFSEGAMNLIMNSFNNQERTYMGLFYSRAGGGEKCGSYGDCYQYWKYIDRTDFYETFFPAIKSGGALTITHNGAVDSSLINGTVEDYASDISKNRMDAQDTSFNSVTPLTLLTTGTITIDLSDILTSLDGITSSSTGEDVLALDGSSSKVTKLTDGLVVDADGSTSTSSEISSADSSDSVVYSGLFKINKNSSTSTPLVESRSQFTDLSKFYGSDYFFSQLGINQSDFLMAQREAGKDNSRMLGDAFVETKLLKDQILNLRNDALFLVDSETDFNNQLKILIDNAVLEKARLNLDITSSLTSDQINSLDKDIIWFESSVINGQNIFSPKIYLSLATRNKLLGTSATLADLNSSKSLTKGTDNSSILSSQITASALNNGSLAKGSAIFAKGNLTINAPSAALTNNGTIISSRGDVNINVGSLNNITNSLARATIKTINIDSTGDYSGSSSVATGNVNITANVGDVLNLGGSVKAVNALNLTANTGSIINSSIIRTNDLNLLNQNNSLVGSSNTSLGFTPYQLTAGTEARSSGNISSTLMQTASLSGGSISINAGNDFTNLAAEINTTKNTFDDATTTTGNAAITAGDDINIDTLQLHNRTESSWGSKKKGGTSITDSVTNIGSNITSEGTINLTTTGLGTDSEAAVSSTTATGSNINITGSNLTTTGSGSNINIAANDEVNIQAAQDAYYKEETYHRKGSTVVKNSMSINETLTNIHSNLTAAGDINITSGANTNLIGANLSAVDVTIDAGDELNIYSVQDQSYSYSSASKSRNYSKIADIASIMMIANAPLLTGVTTSGLFLSEVVAVHNSLNNDVSVKSTSSTHEKTTNAASNINATGNVTLTSNDNLTISGSDVSGSEGTLTSSSGNVEILSAVERDYVSSESNKIRARTKAPGLKGSRKSHDESVETLTNVASNLDFVNDLTIKTLSGESSDINIQGSNLSVSDGDLTLNSSGNINVVNAVDSVLAESSANKKGNTRKSQSQSIDYVETALASSLRASGNINISSIGNTLIQGSNIDTDSNLLIGSFTIDTNSDGSYKKDSYGNYITTSSTTVDNLIIKNADLKEYHYAQTNRGYAGVAAAAMRAAPYVLMPAQIASSYYESLMAVFLPDVLENAIMDYTPEGLLMKGIDKVGTKMGDLKIATKSETRTDKSTSFASNINVYGSMMTNSIGDTTIQGSDLNIAGNLLANSLGSFTISAATNTESTTSQTSYETAGKFHSDLNVRHVNYKAGVIKEFAEVGNESNSSTLVSSNLNIGGSALINSSEEFALLASNLITTGSTEINAKNNLNISDAKNTQVTSSYLDKLTLDVGIQVGNAYADAVYAGLSAVEALEKVKEAKDKLEKIENLQDQGLASSKAVERAQYQLVLAMLNAGLSLNAALQAAYGAAASSETLGFYGAVYADITKLKSTTTTEYAQSIASNLISGDSIYLSSGAEDVNVTGSNISSTNGDLNLTAMLGNINIKAGESTYSTESKSRSQNLGGRVGTNGASLNLGFTESASNLDQTTFTNSQLLAQNGSLNLNSTTDTNIIGANLLAKDINLTVGGNLLVKSKQNLLESDFYSVGASIGISTQSGDSINGANIGLNTADGFQSKAWVEQLTSIIGTNSIIINTVNSTKIVGAEIANIKDGIDYGNLTLNTKSLTFENLKNYNNSESNSMGISLSIGFKDNDPSAPQNSNYNPEQLAKRAEAAKAEEGVVRGPLKIDLSMHASESSSITNSTIGKGAITINGIAATPEELTNLNRDINNTEQNKKTVITSDFDTSLTIDLRLLAGALYTTKGAITGDEKDQVKATNNWDSYWGDTVAGAKVIKQTGIIPLKENNGGIYTQLVVMATGDQSNLKVEMDDSTRTKIIQSNKNLESYQVTQGDKEGEVIITFKDGSRSTLNYNKTDLDDYNSQFKSELNHENNNNDPTKPNYPLISSLASNKDFTFNGINTTESESIRNGLMQLGSLQSNAVNILYDPTHGTLPDLLEVGWNYALGNTNLKSGNIRELNIFSSNLSEAASTYDISGLRAVGHSGGGDRLYLGVLAATENKAFAKKIGENAGGTPIYQPRLLVKFYGTPSFSQNIGTAADKAGILMDKVQVGVDKNDKPIYDYTSGHIINSGDFVGNILGQNAFRGYDKNLKETGKSIISVPKLFIDSSPHSNYWCVGDFCGFEKINLIQPINLRAQ